MTRSRRTGRLASLRAALLRATGRGPLTSPLQLWTFGDSILDCARYNGAGVHPGALLVRNDDALFPAFAGQDLARRGGGALHARAQDGATVADLPRQLEGVRARGPAVALLTIGGNDLLQGLVADEGPGLAAFAARLRALIDALPIRPVLVGNVYDPTFGDDRTALRNPIAQLGVDPVRARANLQRMNALLAAEGARAGTVVDLHAHFLTGDPSWFVQTIEPSLIGASEVRRCFLPHVLAAADRARAAPD